MKNIITILLLLATSTIYAQNCSAYDNLIAEGNVAFSNGNYEKAVKRYNLAMLNCPEKIAEVQEKILGVFNEIEQLKEAANQQKLIAESEKKQAEIARDSTTQLFAQLSIAKTKTDSILLIVKKEQEKNERIVNSFFFYGDSLALASKKVDDGTGKPNKDIFGFINKEGEALIDFKYDIASGFDDTEYANVTREGKNYLINTLGKEYPVATNIKDLNQDIIALDLRNKQINKLSPKIFENTQLEVLLLSGNPLTTVSFKIKSLINLETLDLGANVTISSEVEKLPYLKSLNRRVLQIPIEFIKPIGNNVTGIKSKLPTSGKYDWIVYSDRDNNLTYASSKGDNTHTSINFMEGFYVIGETNTRVELIKYDPSIIYSNTSRKVNMKKADYYGWVEKSKLLLWRNSLINKQTDFTIKALIAHSVSDFVKRIANKKQLTLYNSPNKEANTQNDNDIRLADFLYVFKKQNGKCLVGLSPRVPYLNPQQVIIGWISEKNVQIWSNRLCIEPNDDPEAAAERRAKGIKASIFSNYQAAVGFKTDKSAKFNKVLWDKDKYEVGFPPSWKRMPVIGKLDNNIYKTGVITDVFSKNNLKVLSAEEHARLEAEYNIIREKKQKVNMVFVIDGTKSNHSFFVPIINAIKNSINLFKNSDKKYKLGAVIYGKSGQGVISKQGLTSVHTSVMKLLETYKNKQNIPQDNDEPTDMYEGLRVAIRTLNSDEINIIVLIGDAGNYIADNQRIINELKQNKCGIIAFQTRHVSGQLGHIYNVFINQTKKLILQSSGKSDAPPKLHPYSNNTFRLKYPEESLLPGSLTHSDKGGAMSQAELEEEIRTMLTSFEKQHDHLLRDLDCMVYTDCKTDINEAALEYMLEKIPDIDSSALRKAMYSTDNYQLLVEGYAPIIVDSLEHPLFKHVIFLTRQEFFELEKNLEKLLDVSESPSKLREGIITSYKQILSGYYGSDAKKIADKTSAEILEIITGLPSASPLLTKYSISDLEDRRKVSDNEIQEIYFYIDEKLASMKTIIGNPNYFFRSRDETYYWVPQEVLP